MKLSIIKKTFIAACFAAAGFSTSANAVPIGDLTDGALHIGAVSGEWSLYANAGDFITVTARRLQPSDIWAWATYGATSGCFGCGPGSGDDQLPPLVGGSWGDPQFSFVSAITGLINIDVNYFGNTTDGLALNYNVIATGSTARVPTTDVPEPASLALLGLGLAGLGGLRRKQKIA